MRISFVADPSILNSNYRAYQPLMALRERGHDVDHNRPDAPLWREAELMQADVVFIHRYVGAGVCQWIERLQAAGIGVVWDNDDDLANIPRSNPNYATMGGLKGRRLAADVANVVRLADVVTTPSDVLAAQFRASGAGEARVIENFLPDGFPGGGGLKHSGVVVVWMAALEHQTDYQQLHLRETFERALAAHPDLRLMSIGLNLGLSDPRYEHVRRVDFLELPRAMAGCDVGLAPLADIPWNQARSNVKVKEYGSAGLTWLASPVGAYRGLGEQQGGRLVDDDGWPEALDDLIRDGRARRKLAKKAAKWAKGQTIGRNVELWEAAFADARDRAAARAGRRASA